MPTRTELSLRLPNSPGALSGVCRLLGAERINIQALSLDGGGHLRLIVDNHVHAAAVLREQHHQVAERDALVLSVSNVPGSGAAALGLLADAGVNIEYAYGGTPEGGPASTVVVGVEDAQRAAFASGL